MHFSHVMTIPDGDTDTFRVAFVLKKSKMQIPHCHRIRRRLLVRAQVDVMHFLHVTLL